MMANPEFSIDGYRHMLSQLLDLGYTGAGFADARPQERDLILRHDIDIWPEYSVATAQVEQQIGLSAWYFFLVRCPLYNLMAPESTRVLKEIQDLGHKVGLHFDAALFPDDEAVLEAELSFECSILETLTGQPVEMISFHRPSQSLVGRDALVAGRDHTYRPRYIREMGYCSDSRGEWRHGHPFKNEAVIEGRALQLLTHPVWWSTNGMGHVANALADFERRHSESVVDALSNTITGYPELMKSSRDVEGAGE